MRIAYLCTDFGIPILGTKGASIHVRELSRALQALGHDVRIFSPRSGGGDASGFDVPITSVPLTAAHQRTYDRLRGRAASDQAAAAIRSLLYNGSLPARIQDELTSFEPDFVYERHALFGRAGKTLARRLGVPLILEVNAPLSVEQARHRCLAFGVAARRIEREVLWSAHRVVAVSSGIAQWLVESGVRRDRITILPNAVDTERFDPSTIRIARSTIRRSLGLSDAPVVGFVGSLKPWHDTATLVRALALLNRRGVRSRLLVVGDGPRRAAMAELAEREGIAAQVRFAGAVPHEAVPGYLAAMDVAVAPYPPGGDSYFSPLKIFEYMAAALPVVAADVGDIPRHVPANVAGLLYPAGDVHAMADAIEGLLANAPRAAALGEAGRRRVRRRRTWAGNAQIVAALAETLTQSGRAAMPAATARHSSGVVTRS